MLKKMLIPAVVLTTVLLVCVDILLVRANRLLARENDALTRVLYVEPNTVVPALSGTSLSGQKVDIEFDKDAPATLILTFVEGCHACDAAWDQWEPLLANTSLTGVRVVLVSGRNSISQEYVKRHQLDRRLCLTKISDENLSIYRLRTVPQAILVSGKGRVVNVWGGAPSWMTRVNILQTISAVMSSGSKT